MAERRPAGYPKLKNYRPSRFMLSTSHYDKAKINKMYHDKAAVYGIVVISFYHFPQKKCTNVCEVVLHLFSHNYK